MKNYPLGRKFIKSNTNEKIISFNKDTNEFHLFTDSGRIIRPIFRLKKKNGKNFNEKYSLFLRFSYIFFDFSFIFITFS